jgi:hypothetical protein
MQETCLKRHEFVGCEYNFEKENTAAPKAALTFTLEGARLETRARA